MISPQSIPNQPSAHPRVANAWEPILHASWKLDCAFGAMVSLFIVAGVFAIVVMESLPLLMQRRLCHCQASIVSLVAHCQAGAVTLVVMALLPLMRRRLCHCRDGNWLLLSRWCCCHCQCAGISTVVELALPLLLVATLVAMAPLLLMCRHLCHRRHCHCWPHDDGIAAVVNAQVSLLSSSWQHCPHNNGIVALDP